MNGSLPPVRAQFSCLFAGMLATLRPTGSLPVSDALHAFSSESGPGLEANQQV